MAHNPVAMLKEGLISKGGQVFPVFQVGTHCGGFIYWHILERELN